MKNLLKKSLLLVLSILLFQIAGNTQSESKNGIGVSLHGGTDKYGARLEYTRQLTNQFSLVGSLGRRIYQSSTSTLSSSLIKGESSDFGIGVEFSQMKNGKGYFLEGGLNLSRANWSAVGSKLEDGVAPNLMGNQNNIQYSGTIKKTALNVYGKLGYRFMHNSGKFSFAPIVMFQPVAGKDELLMNSFDGQKTHKLQVGQGINLISVGFETKFHF